VRVLWLIEATGGGTARHVVELASGLAEQGLKIHIVFSPRRADAVWVRGSDQLVERGVRLIPLSMRASPELNDPRKLYWLRNYIVKHGPFDLSHGHSSKGGALSRLLRIGGGPPSVYTPHAFATLRSGIQGKIYSLAERALAPYTAALIAVSPEEAEEAQRLGYSKERVRVIPNGLDPTSFRPLSRCEARDRLGLPQEMQVVGFLGRLDSQKNPDLLLSAFSLVATHFPRALLVFTGEGPLRQLLVTRASALGLIDRVRFLGFRPPEEVLPAYDILALPSRYEGFPYVLIEALLSGLPIIATRTGGAALAVVEESNGYLIPRDDALALARALTNLLGSQSLRKKMGIAARERAHKFSLKQMVVSTLDLYRDLVDFEQ